MDSADDLKPVETIEPDRFPEKILVHAKKHAINEGQKNWPGLVIWTDGFTLDLQVRIAVCGRAKTLNLWKEKGVFLGKNKEIFDVELWQISIALDITAKKNTKCRWCISNNFL